jgi:hypothetical protein
LGWDFLGLFELLGFSRQGKGFLGWVWDVSVLFGLGFLKIFKKGFGNQTPDFVWLKMYANIDLLLIILFQMITALFNIHEKFGIALSVLCFVFGIPSNLLSILVCLRSFKKIRLNSPRVKNEWRKSTSNTTVSTTIRMANKTKPNQDRSELFVQKSSLASRNTNPHRKCFELFLIEISICDLIILSYNFAEWFTLILSRLNYIDTMYSEFIHISEFMCRFVIALNRTVILLHNWLVAFLALTRCYAIYKPLNSNILVSSKFYYRLNLFVLLIMIVLFATANIFGVAMLTYTKTRMNASENYTVPQHIIPIANIGPLTNISSLPNTLVNLLSDNNTHISLESTMGHVMISQNSEMNSNLDILSSDFMQAHSSFKYDLTYLTSNHSEINLTEKFQYFVECKFREDLYKKFKYLDAYVNLAIGVFGYTLPCLITLVINIVLIFSLRQVYERPANNNLRRYTTSKDNYFAITGKAKKKPKSNELIDRLKFFKATGSLLFISLSYLVCYMPFTLLFLLLSLDKLNMNADLIFILTSLRYFNHTLNFYIYYATGKRFRTDVKNYLKIK